MNGGWLLPCPTKRAPAVRDGAKLGLLVRVPTVDDLALHEDCTD